MSWISSIFSWQLGILYDLQTATALSKYAMDPVCGAFMVGIGSIAILRVSVSDMFYASCSGEYGFKRGRSIGRRIANEQNLWGIITRRYMKEYICDRLKKPFKVYLLLSRLIEIIFIPGIIALGYIGIHENELPYAESLLDIVDTLSFVVAGLLILQENPRTFKTRFIDYKFKNRNGDYF